MEFQLKFVLKETSRRARKEILNFLPSTRDDAFESIIQHITETSTNGIKIVLPVLSWILHAKRVLTMGEIREAILFSEGTHPDDIGDNDYTAPEIIKTCESLIIHEISSGKVRFCHATVGEWLPNSTVWNRLPRPVDITKTCIKYFGSGVFDEPCTSEHSLRQRRERYVLSSYASQHWGDHARDVEREIEDDVLKIFRSYKTREAMYQVRDFLAIHWMVISFEERGVSLLHILCENGLTVLCETFRARGFDIDDLYVSSSASAKWKISEIRGIHLISECDSKR